ncbi:transcriptional repressor LexA [Neobacillus sp. NPDC093127]|uniref:transcriptional repressor LexA n=1 Tax=Neobacillus sp. NPDC093127 TaxID=3364296 RepID=UPI00381B2F3D
MLTNPKEFGSYIKALRTEKGLSIRQLRDKTGVSNAYFSHLENGKRGIPSPEILMKIHEPLGVSYDELMEKAGYISAETRLELLPETIKTMKSYKDLIELVNNASEMFIGAMFDDPKEFKQILVNEVQATHADISREEMDEVINNPESMFEHLTLEEKISFLNGIIKDFVQQGIDPSEIFKSNSEKIDDNRHPVLFVPVLGYIAAGQPILAEEHIEEWTEIPNMWNLKENEAIVLKVKGDSMIGSRIFEGDKVVIKLQPEVENGEIAVVNINGDEATLKRVKKTENGQVILYPDNPNYEPIFITNEKARIIGKVVQVMFEPK